MQSRILPFAAALISALFLVPSASADEATDSLAIAIMSSDPAMARAAIEAGASVNADLVGGRTPLIVAAMMTKPVAVKLLLERGADANRNAGDAAIGNALTAAFFASNGVALLGRADERDPAKHAEALIVLRLIASQRPNCDLLVSRGPTRVSPLMMAAEAGVPEAVKILLDAGASPNFVNGGKYAALDYAVEKPPIWSQASATDRMAVVRLLLAAGAQTQHKGADGLSTVERARKAGNQALVDILVASR